MGNGPRLGVGVDLTADGQFVAVTVAMGVVSLTFGVPVDQGTEWIRQFSHMFREVQAEGQRRQKRGGLVVPESRIVSAG